MVKRQTRTTKEKRPCGRKFSQKKRIAQKKNPWLD